jgi:hypothetical protein
MTLKNEKPMIRHNTILRPLVETLFAINIKNIKKDIHNTSRQLEIKTNISMRQTKIFLLDAKGPGGVMETRT